MVHIYALGFSVFSGIGTRRFEKLLAVFGSAKIAWEAAESELIAVLGETTGNKFLHFRKAFDVQKYAEGLRNKKIHFFVPSDSEYPVLLKQLDHPPFVLFAKGNVQLLQSEKTIGIVGTRKPTPYGRQVTEMLVDDLVSEGFVIVSGMALGIDGIAHSKTLSRSGLTIAVLGSGVDVPTPREHAKLYEDILEKNGLVVSTFSPGEDASKGSFPARNAIIAGLSKAIIVTEGAKDSGSLITAQYAKQFGRLIFAVPGQITSYLSEGANSLIRDGAKVASSIHDIIGTLGVEGTVEKRNHTERNLSPDEAAILTALATGPLLFDEIVRTIGKDSKSIGSLLSLMELKGLITVNSDGTYRI